MHGFDVTVVTGYPISGDGAAPPAREVRNGVTIVRASGTTFSPRRFVGRATNYVTYFLSALWAALWMPRPDVAVALTDPPIIGLAALASRPRCGFVFYCQDIFPEVAGLLEDFKSPLVNSFLEHLNRFLVSRARRIIALGDAMADRLVNGKGAEPSKISVIHNWADTEAIVPSDKRNVFSEAHGLADRFVVLHAGNIGLSQNLDAVIDAADRLRDRRDIVFLFIGDGNRRETLASQAASRSLEQVRFLPYQPRDQLRWTYATRRRVPRLAQARPRRLHRAQQALSDSGRGPPVRRRGRSIDRSGGDRRAASVRRRRVTRRPQGSCRLDGGACGRPGHARQARVERAECRGALRARSPGGGSRVGRGRPRLRMLKRAFDIVVSGTGLLVSSPIWVLVAVAIKVEDGGPILFAQERVGLGGRVFRAYKFRSMVPDAERHTGAVQATANDPRVTRVGRVLRSTALDELPQLWNILKGDMSIVGPRPLRPGEADTTADGRHLPLASIPGYERRHRIRPGLTGIAQVYAPRDMPRTGKFKYDLLYQRRAGFCLDLRLILRSFWITARGAWEHPPEKR